MRPPRDIAPNEGRALFDIVAQTYREARPPYPMRVWDVLRERGGLRRGTRVLEIGAGTGEATRHLLETGASVVAIEPGPGLAKRLRTVAKQPMLTVMESAFEEALLSDREFDLVVAATSFHWLEPTSRVAKSYQVLRPGGCISLWWNVFGDPSQPDPFHDATLALLSGLRRSPSEGSGALPFALDASARKAELRRGGFVGVTSEQVHWDLSLSARQVRSLYGTYTNITSLPRDEREAILDAIEDVALNEFGGAVQRRMVTPIYTGRRPDRPSGET